MGHNLHCQANSKKSNIYKSKVLGDALLAMHYRAKKKKTWSKLIWLVSQEITFHKVGPLAICLHLMQGQIHSMKYMLRLLITSTILPSAKA